MLFRLPKKPLPQYVGVDRSQMYNTLFTYRLLGYLSSAKQPLDGAANYSLENCTAPENQSVYDYIFMSGTEPPPGFNGTMEDCRNTLGCGYCYNITAKLIKAVSPGKVLFLLEACFDLILSPSPSVKIQIMDGRITKNLGFESLLRKVKKFFVLFLFIFKFSTKNSIFEYLVLKIKY